MVAILCVSSEMSGTIAIFNRTPSTPTQINSNFLSIKGIIINLHYNGICQSKVILLKEKCPVCNPQTPLTFYRRKENHFSKGIFAWYCSERPPLLTDRNKITF